MFGKKPETPQTPPEPKKEAVMAPADPKKEVAFDSTNLNNRLGGVYEEIARFVRKLDELRKVAGETTAIKPSHPALKAVRRASQDVSSEMMALRALLSVKE